MWHQLTPLCWWGPATLSKWTFYPIATWPTTRIETRDQNNEDPFYKTGSYEGHCKIIVQVQEGPQEVSLALMESSNFLHLSRTCRESKAFSLPQLWCLNLGQQRHTDVPFHLWCTTLFIMAPIPTCVDCQCGLFPLLDLFVFNALLFYGTGFHSSLVGATHKAIQFFQRGRG